MQIQLSRNESFSKEIREFDSYFGDFSAKIKFIENNAIDLQGFSCPDIPEDKYLCNISPRIEKNFWNPMKHNILCDTLDHVYSPKKDPAPPTKKSSVKHEESVSETIENTNEPDTGKKKKRRRRKKNKKNKSNVQDTSNSNSGTSHSDDDLANNMNDSNSKIPPKEE